MKVKFYVPVLMMLFTILMPLGYALAESPVKISGKVEAIDPSANPKTLVMKSPGPGGKELTVGCRLDDKTVIRARGSAATLEDFGSVAKL